MESQQSDTTALLNYDELRAAEMEHPEHVVFRISGKSNQSMRAGAGGAQYARVSIRTFGNAAELQQEILTQMAIPHVEVSGMEYHRRDSSKWRSLESLYDDSDFLRGLASYESSKWTLYLNIIRKEGIEKTLSRKFILTVHFYEGSWVKMAQGWKHGSVKVHRWDEHSIECDSDMPLVDLPDRLGRLILEEAREDSVHEQAIAGRKCRIRFTTAIMFGPSRISLDEGTNRIASLMDILEDPSGPHIGAAHVVLQCEKVPKGLKDREEVVDRALPANTRVVWRLGNAIDVKKKKEVSTSTKSGTELSRPQSDFALLMFRETTPKEESGIISTHIYDFGTYCIGDCYDNYRIRNFSKNHDYFPPFEELKEGGSKALITKLVHQYSAQDDPQQVGSGVPFLPDCSCNELTEEYAQTLGLGVDIRSWTFADHIDFAVSCFNHLEGDWEFPYDITLERITMTALPNKIRQAIEGILRQYKGFGENKHAYAPKLLEKDKREEWSIELWVMPQMSSVNPEKRKLYLWSQDEDDEGELLTIFFDQLAWDKRERWLYVEAHFVPVGKDSIIAGKKPRWML